MPHDQPAAVKRLDLRYLSPAQLYVLDDIQIILAWGLGLTVYGLWFWLLVWENSFGLSGAQRLFALVAGAGLAHATAMDLGRFLMAHWVASGLHPWVDHLVGEFRAGAFRIRVNDRWLVFDAAAPHQWMMREHHSGTSEARAEERSRSLGLGQQPDYYRRAFEIILDTGDRRFALADVAFEEDARRIVRRLQTLDAHARGAEVPGIATKHAGMNAAAPADTRPILD